MNFCFNCKQEVEQGHSCAVQSVFWGENSIAYDGSARRCVETADISYVIGSLETFRAVGGDGPEALALLQKNIDILKKVIGRE